MGKVGTGERWEHLLQYSWSSSKRRLQVETGMHAQAREHMDPEWETEREAALFLVSI